MFAVSRTLAQVSSLLFAASMLLPVEAYSSQEKSGAAARPAMPVSVLEVKSEDKPVFFEYPGRTQAVQQATVYARVNGILQKKFYEDGQVVKAGQMLYQIDDRRYQALVNKAKAQVQVAQASLNQAEREYNRVSGLFKKKAVSEQERDTAISNLELAKASLEGAKAALNDAQIDLDYTKVKAEISGVTGIKQQDVGNLVGTDAKNSQLTTITQLDSIYVVYAIPDSQRLSLHKEIVEGKVQVVSDDKLTAEIINDKQQVLAKGTVDFTDSKIDAETGSVQARAIFDNSNSQFLPGEFVRLRVYSATRKNVFAIPQKAVLQMGQQAFVYVVNQGLAELTPVVLAAQYGDNWLVEAGLKNDDKVIVSNLIKLRPKSPVQILPAAASAGKPAQKAQ
ncbi:efflux RND transporter periplasmic adaptor subunit [Thiomicrorhabdus sp. ZW0627]|uniref:efflux RND transporter periplasmic adaptor subunit n=1 Tax=Thiomicrorhabdus sp. ZW0627 TaxID=3039774 RepID=UPI00243714BF|nr:efflux RND transporter periplasmic adaptor subunit [Thiomicrorhabdus sp. ZW0627]MDG6774118.1 efflux RND transporter periplasmic adaptor subunit [Thiomicrorhabdus sp. ZW0627]